MLANESISARCACSWFPCLHAPSSLWSTKIIGWSSKIADVKQENDRLSRSEFAKAERARLATQSSELTHAQAVADTNTERAAKLERKVRSLSTQLSAVKSRLDLTQSQLSTAQLQLDTASPPVILEADPSGGTLPVAPGGDCDPNYGGACVPVVPYDLDCADVDGSVYVLGTDPHGFDGDGDGVGCEW